MILWQGNGFFDADPLAIFATNTLFLINHCNFNRVLILRKVFKGNTTNRADEDAIFTAIAQLPVYRSLIAIRPLILVQFGFPVNFLVIDLLVTNAVNGAYTGAGATFKARLGAPAIGCSYFPCRSTVVETDGIRANAFLTQAYAKPTQDTVLVLLDKS